MALDVVLDTHRLATLVDEVGDIGTVRGAVGAFLEEIPFRLRAVARAAVAGTPQEVGQAAHALGSPASMLGAEAVRAVTSALQDAAARGADEEYPWLVDDLESALARTEAAMRDYLDATASA